MAMGREWEQVSVRVAKGEKDWKRVARLRAECYYETRSKGRFTASYKKMFEEQEQRRLETMHIDRRQEIATFMADGGAEEIILGSVDVSKHGKEAGENLEAYVCNLCVSPTARRRGVGQKLMCIAAQYAQDEWEARSMHAHVDSDNTAATTLYTRIGFRKISEGKRKDSPIGRVFLLEAMLPLKDAAVKKEFEEADL